MFYLGTALITAVVTNAASVVSMLPNAVEVVTRLDVDAFAVALAVSFATSPPLRTPVEDQPNLLEAGPGGYKFTDLIHEGAPPSLIRTL